MSAPTHPFLASPDARALDGYLSELATNWVSRFQSSTEAHALFSAFGRVYFQTISKVAREWNLTHDKLRIFPPELRDRCMFSLPVYDKLRLAEVCSSWKEMSSLSSDLWSTITVDEEPIRLPAVLRRSGRRPLDVTIPVSNNEQLISAAISLRSTADRLRFLRIDFAYAPARHESETAFPYSLPMLDELQLHYMPSRAAAWANSCGFDIPSNLFNNDAPNLRCVALSGVGLPTTCRALAQVSSVSIKGPCNGIERVFSLFPSLQKLEIVGIGLPRSFSPVPRNGVLAEVSIRHNSTDFDTLDALGLLELPRINVSGYDRSPALVTKGAGKVDLALCPESTLVIAASCSVDLIVRRGPGVVVRLSVLECYLANIGAALTGGHDFAALRHLVFPLRLRYLDRNDRGQPICSCPLLRGPVELLSLRSLTLRAGSETQTRHSFIDPVIKRGVLTAPLLAKIVVDREREEYGPVEINAAHLSAFITNTVICDDPRALELFIDTASGLRLHTEDAGDAEMARLRDCVGTLLYRI